MICPDCWLSPSQDKESYGFDTKTFFKHYEGVVRETKKMKAWKETDTAARERLSEKLKNSWPAQVYIHSWMTAGVISDHDLFKLALELYIHNGPQGEDAAAGQGLASHGRRQGRVAAQRNLSVPLWVRVAQSCWTAMWFRRGVRSCDI